MEAIKLDQSESDLTEDQSEIDLTIDPSETGHSQSELKAKRQTGTRLKFTSPVSKRGKRQYNYCRSPSRI